MPDATRLEPLDPLPERFDPDKRYEVRLTETIRFGTAVFNPMNVNTFSGEFAEMNRFKIASARVVE